MQPGGPLAGTHRRVHDLYPGPQTQLGAVKRGPGGHGELAMACTALQQPGAAGVQATLAADVEQIPVKTTAPVASSLGGMTQPCLSGTAVSTGFPFVSACEMSMTNVWRQLWGT